VRGSIAHRLHTVAYYDRVLVMDKGAAAEYGSPLALIDDRATIFHRMCQRSGDFDLLRAMAADSDALDEVIVTAQRRSESIQNVPISMQAFTEKALEDLHVQTFDDYVKYLPNVSSANNGPGQNEIFMRGLSGGYAGEQSAGTIGGFPNVALYLDDQSMQFPAHNADIYVADIERVEVLEGPQGTLFGGGAQAGAVRYITAKPKYDRIEGKMEGSFGGTAGGAPNAAFNAMINLPIIKDKLAIRAVIYDDHHGGYINNEYSTFTRQPTDLGSYYVSYKGNGNVLTPGQQVNGGQYNNASLVQKASNPVDYVGGRIELGWKIAPDWDLLLAESYQKLDTKGTFATQSYSYDYAPLTGLSSTLFNPQYSNDDYWNTAWTLNGKIGDFKVVYTGAYMARHISQQGDYTNYARATYGIFYQCTNAGNYYFGTYGKAPYCYSPTGYWTDHIRTTHQSHEFRVTTPEGKRVRAILGAYYESFKIQDNQDWDYKSIPTCSQSQTPAQIAASGSVCLGLVAPNPAATLNVQGPRGPAVAFGEDTQRGYKQYAAFGSVDFDITSNLTLTGGTRYYNYKEYETGSVYSSFNAGCYQVPVCVTGNNLNADNLNVSYHGFKSRAVITWKPQQHTMLYALFSQGFRPGGFNRGPSARVQDPTLPFINATTGMAEAAKTSSKDGKNFQLLVSSGYRPDTLTNWEMGLKTDLFDRKVTLNLSGYYMVWQDTQVGFFNPAAGFGNTAFATNGPTYHIKGLEAQIVARPTTGLSIQGSATYNDSKQSNSPCFIANNPTASSFGKCITQVYSGNVNSPNPVQSPFGNVGDITPFSPHVQANARARYDWAGKADFNWFVSGGISYTGSMYNEPATYPSGDVAGNGSVVGPNGIIVPATTVLRYKMPGFALLDASFGFSHDNWTVTIFGENLTNTHASTFTNSAEYIKTQVPVRPLIYGLKISTKL
jgi:outer membrane receptor protein involved in Fe transport